MDGKQEASSRMRPRQAGRLGGFNGAVVEQPCKAKPTTQSLFTAVDGGLEVRALEQRVDLAVKILLTSSLVHSRIRTKPPGPTVTSADPPLRALIVAWAGHIRFASFVCVGCFLHACIVDVAVFRALHEGCCWL